MSAFCPWYALSHVVSCQVLGSALRRSAVPWMGAAGIWTGDERPSVGWAPGPGRWVLLHLSLLLCYLRVFAGGTLQFVVVLF